LKDGVDHYFPSTIPCLGTIHTSKRKNKITNEIEAIAMIDNIFAQLDLFLTQQV
jgi:hypothetical protein